jgi:hypothetical protein
MTPPYFVTEDEFDRIVDPAKMVRPYVAIAREQEPDRNLQPAKH